MIYPIISDGMNGNFGISIDSTRFPVLRLVYEVRANFVLGENGDFDFPT